MFDLPDAPWIRDAETNGMPEDDPPKCPVCGEECETLYYFGDYKRDIVGCDCCLHTMSAWDYEP